MNPDLQKRIEQLERDLFKINQEVYTNNFSARQDFNKYSNFTTRLKVPYYAVAPATCEVGEIIEVGGKLRICSAANTWTIVGTQS
jgi:hypothetical protein